MTITVKFDLASVDRFSQTVAAISGARLISIQSDAVRKTLLVAYDLSLKQMDRGINLNQAYLTNRLRLEPPQENETRGAVTSSGQRAYLTALSHYGARQTVTAAPKAKGSRSRGIQPGYKSAGVSIEVIRGARKQIDSDRVFLAPNILDSEGNPFVFKRIGGATKSGKRQLQRLMGPGVYQLFRHSIPAVVPAVETALGDFINSGLQEAIAT